MTGNPANAQLTVSADVFRAVADPTRRAILDLLRNGGQPVGEIARSFPVSRPAISKHLRLLRQTALVRERREGRSRIYQLNAAALVSVDEWLQAYREFWKKSLLRLKDEVESQEARGLGARPRKRRGRRKRPSS